MSEPARDDRPRRYLIGLSFDTCSFNLDTLERVSAIIRVMPDQARAHAETLSYNALGSTIVVLISIRPNHLDNLRARLKKVVGIKKAEHITA